MNQANIDFFAEIGARSNPFPGLRPFEVDESHLFFGRSGQSQQLIAKLSATRFLAVVGTSGSGKSSLARAGLLPALYGGFMAGAGSAWRVAIMRPGADAIGNLARALNNTEVFGSEDPENNALQVAITEATLRRGGLGLVEAVRQANMPATENLLVVVDQFEEIFRVEHGLVERGRRDEGCENDKAAFIKLLLGAKNQTETPIYVALTMRSDYLGDCAQFWDLPEAINEGQYLIPRLTREQRRAAITGPIAVAGGEITPRLVNRLLNDVGDNPDQLPILQHALMRTWDEWRMERESGRAGERETRGQGDKENPQSAALDLLHYEAVGGMAQALSRHADEAFDEVGGEMGARSQQIAEKMFKALTEKGADNRETRRPVTLGEICDVTEADVAEVISVIEKFRAPGRSFLTPQAGASLDADSLIDISHESLIRGWKGRENENGEKEKRLNEWVEEEARSARIYVRLADTAVLHRDGQAGLWRDPDLKLALDWQEKQSPNRHWARRYQPEFDLAMDFLRASRERQIEEIFEREHAQQEKLKQAEALAEAQRQRLEEQTRSASRLRRFVAALIVASLLALLAAGYAFSAYRSASEQKKIAVKQKAEADNQKIIAEAEKRRAEENQKTAEDQALIALRQTGIANEATAEAKRQKEVADGAAYVAKMNLARAEFESGNMIRGFELLDAYLPQNNMRSFYWYYLWRQNHNELSTFKGRGEGYYSVAFSPDGRTLASGSSEEKAVRLWDAKTGQELATLNGHRSAVTSVAFSPDGRTLASGSLDGTVRLWDAKTRQGAAIPKAHGEPVLAVAFSPDGRTLASGGSDTVKLWDTNSEKNLATLLGHKSNVTSVAFSPNGRTLVSGSLDATVRLWDARTRQESAISKAHVHGEPVTSVSFSPDGRTLASGSSDNTVKLWDAESGKELATLKGHKSPVNSVAFLPDGRTLASGSWDKTVKLWDAKTGRELATLKGHEDTVYSVAVSPDGRTLAGGSWGTVKLWDAKTGQEPITLKGPNLNVFSVAFSPDGRTLAGGIGDVTVMWDAKTGRELATLEGHGGNVYSVAFSPDGRTLATGSPDNAVKLWDTKTGRKLAALKGHADIVTSVAFSPDGRTLASGSRDNTVKLWDAKTGRKLATLEGHGSYVYSVAFSPDGRTLAGGAGDAIIRIWDAKTGRELATLNGHESPVNSMAFSPDGRTLASGSEDKTVKLWDAKTWHELTSLKGHRGSVNSVAFSPDGRTLASGSYDNTVKLWDAKTGQELATLKGHEDYVYSVAFSSDGRTLASGSEDRTVRLWRGATDEEIARQRSK